MTKSVYRYPGGKVKMATKIAEYFRNFDTVLCPFLGGGSVELNLADLDKRVISADIDKHLINCWQTLCQNKDEMYEYAKEYYDIFHSDISKEKKRDLFYEIKESAGEWLDVKGAAQYWVVNRISFSGLGLLGGFSEQAIKAEFGPLILKRLKEWKKPECFEIPQCLPFTQMMMKYPDVPMFLDPPYPLKKDWLYPNHKNFDHVKLATFLRSTNIPFMMTYSNCTEIKELYQHDSITIEENEWYYGMTNKRQGKELFISRGIK
jgi:DNA adenine methylase